MAGETREIFRYKSVKNLKSEQQDWYNYMKVNEITYIELLQMITLAVQRQDKCS